MSLRVAPWFCVAALVAACSVASRNSVEVYCEGGFTGVECVVKHVAGPDRIRATWDYRAECANGAVVSASGAQVVAPGQTTSRTIPESQIRNLAACDYAVSVSIENIQMLPAN